MVWALCKNRGWQIPPNGLASYNTGKEHPERVGEEWIRMILKRGNEWEGVRATARDRERWKALCEPSTSTGRRGSTR